MRQSPINVKAVPKTTRNHAGFEVALVYDNETDPLAEATAIVDLSHMAKWDIQDKNLNRMQPLGVNIPKTPGECALYADQSPIFRLNATQAGIWHIRPNEPSSAPEAIPSDPAYSDVTDAYALLGITGAAVPSFMEKITPLDLTRSNLQPPFIVQGPILHITCRIVVLKLTTEHSALLVSFARNFGQTMVEALLDAGSRQSVYLGGENVFFKYLMK